MKLVASKLSVSIKEQVVCDQLDIEFNQGEFWGVLGANGIGKTTLLKSLIGLLSIQQGEIFVNHQSIKSSSVSAQQISFLYQNYSDVFPISVYDYVLSGRFPHVKFWGHYQSIDHGICQKNIQLFELAEFKDRNIQTLSGGERKRASLAQLMTQNADLMVLDEPLNHLDLKHQVFILKHLKMLCREQEKCVLMTLHDINFARHFCDKVLLLGPSGEINLGLTKDILIKENIEALVNYPMLKIQQSDQSYYFPSIAG